MENGGYVIKAIEFHQSAYDAADSGKNAVSVFDVLLNVANEDMTHRWIVRTKLRIEWTPETDEEGLYVPGALTVFDTTILERAGSAVFEHRILQPDQQSFPIVYDLNRDGFSDILLPTDNTVMLNRGDGQFEDRPLFLAPGIAPPYPVLTAIAADFTRDGYVDLLCIGDYKNTPTTDSSSREGGVFLFLGDGTVLNAGCTSCFAIPFPDSTDVFYSG
jgi:hypothetical protein